MVRVGGLDYTIDPLASQGNRISNMTLNGQLLDANKTYKVAGWASVAEDVEGTPIWDVVAEWLQSKKSIPLVEARQPKVLGIKDNQGLA